MAVVLNPGLYAITDPFLLSNENLFTSVESALAGGCRLIQYRDKLASNTERLQRAKKLSTLCRQYQAQLIINDDLTLCLESNADGVHLGKSDGDIISARRQLGDSKILGVTCHNDLSYAQQCIDLGVDYCAFGRIFPSYTKPNAPQCDLSVLEYALKLSKPVVAIGGITLDNIKLLMQTPVHNAAVIHGLFSEQDIQKTAQKFQSYFSF